MLKTKSIIYTKPGPLTNLSIHKHSLNPLVPLKILFAPINPSDINMIEGVYPIKPIHYKFGYIPGQEGVGIALKTYGEVKEGEWVVPVNQSFNTFQTHASADPQRVVRVDGTGLTEKFVGSVSVNPSTAFVMLKRFVELRRGDTVIQNCGSSHVGRCVVQLCKAWGYRSISIIRARDTLEESEALKKELYGLGADLVLFEDEVVKRRGEIQEMKPRLGFNGVGGDSCTNMARLLDDNGVLVTYGGMSKKPVVLPTSLFIFKNITSKGFWLNKYFLDHDIKVREGIYQELFDLFRDGKLSEPVGEEISLGRVDSTEEEDELLLSNLTRVSRLKKFLVADRSDL